MRVLRRVPDPASASCCFYFPISSRAGSLCPRATCWDSSLSNPQQLRQWKRQQLQRLRHQGQRETPDLLTLIVLVIRIKLLRSAICHFHRWAAALHPMWSLSPDWPEATHFVEEEAEGDATCKNLYLSRLAPDLAAGCIEEGCSVEDIMRIQGKLETDEGAGVSSGHGPV